MGAFRPIAETFFHRCMAAVNLPDPEAWEEATFMPSGRSVAFRRDAIQAAGGYPEWLAIGEDMYVDRRWRELGMDMRLARDAVAWWRLRPDLRSTWIQYVRYARGDAIADMYPERHALRFAVYAGALFAWSSRSRVLRFGTLVGGAVYAATPLRRVMRRVDDPIDRAKAAVAVPALMGFVDAAKMTGYVAGLWARRRHS